MEWRLWCEFGAETWCLYSIVHIFWQKIWLLRFWDNIIVSSFHLGVCCAVPFSTLCYSYLPCHIHVQKSAALLRCRIIGGYNLHLCLSVAFGEDLLESCLKDTNVVVDDGFLFSRAVITHDTDERKVPIFVRQTSMDELEHSLVQFPQI